MMHKLSPLIQQGAIVSHIWRLHRSGEPWPAILKEAWDLNDCFKAPLPASNIRYLFNVLKTELSMEGGNREAQGS